MGGPPPQCSPYHHCRGVRVPRAVHLLGMIPRALGDPEPVDAPDPQRRIHLRPARLRAHPGRCSTAWYHPTSPGLRQLAGQPPEAKQEQKTF